MNKVLLPLAAVSVCMLRCAAHADTVYVSLSGSDAAAGTAEAPWRTIQKGADALKPGDTLLIGSGIYRERIEIKRGGTARAPIALAALPGAHVIVSGADRLSGGWSRAAGTEDGVYFRDWAYRFPIGGPNELTHPGDREHQLTGRAEQVIHGGRLLRQVLTRQQLAPGTFFADLDARKLYIWLRGSDDPRQTEMEASVRSNWLVAPASVSYVHVRGVTFRYAANHAQRGAFAIGQETAPVARGWLVEDCVFERANGPGASMSGQGHVFRRCVFQDNGQLGFGTSRCHDTRMEQCGIYRNNTKGYSTGWEAGGCKVTMSRGFVFDGCRAVDNRGVGLWYDIGNEQAEVKNCYIADNDEAGIFYEISYSLHAHDNLIVNNANNGEAVGGAWGAAGITLSSSEDCVVEYNTLIGNRDGIALREQDRTTPRIDAPEGGKEMRVLNKNHLIRDNLIAYSQAYNIAFWMDTTFFGPHPSGDDRNSPLSEDPKTLNIRLENNLLWPLSGRPNYLYGVPWRSRGKQCRNVAEFSALSGIKDTSRIADPRFADVQAGDYRLLPGSPASTMGAGVRAEARLPYR
jgi:parallel beta-helix repeat protein